MWFDQHTASLNWTTQTMNRPRSLAYKQTNLSYNAPYGSTPTTDYHLGGLKNIGECCKYRRGQFFRAP